MGTLAVSRTDIPKEQTKANCHSYTSHKKALYGEQAGLCNGCGTHFLIDNFHCDHIVPKAKGGTDQKIT